MACRIVVVLASIVIGLQLWVSQHLQSRHLYLVLGEVGQFDHLQWTQLCALHDEEQLNFGESSETIADFGDACHPDVDHIVGLHLAALEVPAPISLSIPSLSIIAKNYDAGRVVTRFVPSYRCSMDPAQWPELDGECLYAVLYWIHTLRPPTPSGCRRMRAEIRSALSQRPALFRQIAEQESMSPSRYSRSFLNTGWGGLPEIRVLAQVHAYSICVVDHCGRTIMATTPVVPQQETHRIQYLPGHYVYAGIMSSSRSLATTSDSSAGRGGARRRRSSQEPTKRHAPSPPPDSPVASPAVSPSPDEDHQEGPESDDAMPPPPVPDNRPPLPRRKRPRQDVPLTSLPSQEAPASAGGHSSSSTSNPIVTVDELGVVLPASGPERFEQSLQEDPDSPSGVADPQPEDLDGQPLSAGIVYMLGKGAFKMCDPDLYPVPFCLTCKKWAFVDHRVSKTHKNRYAWHHALPLQERNEYLDDMVKRADEHVASKYRGGALHRLIT